MYRFPLTNIVLNKQERNLLEAINQVHMQNKNPMEIKKSLDTLDQKKIKSLYSKYYLKEYDGVYYNPNITDEITYIIFLDKKHIEIEIPFYVDDQNNKYEFHEDTKLIKRIMKKHGGIIRYMHDHINRLAEEIDGDHHYIYRHYTDYTEKYDKQSPNPNKSREVIEPSMTNVRYDLNFFIEKMNIKPYYVESKSIKKLMNLLVKQNMVTEQIFRLLSHQKHILITIPAFEKEYMLETLESIKLKYKRISIETNTYKCRGCGQVFFYQIDRDQIRCPHCQFVNILTK